MESNPKTTVPRLAGNNHRGDDDLDRDSEIAVFHLPPDMPVVPALTGLIGRCSEPFEKTLTKSDVYDRLNRLMLHKAQTKYHVFPLLDDPESEFQGPVKMYSAPTGKEYDMIFKIWSGGKGHVIHKQWRYLVKDMELKEGQTVRIWTFVHVGTGDLSFIISRVEET